MTVLLLLPVGVLVAGCASEGPPEGQVGHVTDNFGGVVSDEPRSALVGRDVLSSGGNAVDAVVATYFTLSVTYPDAATLGGGGVCVLHGYRGEDGKGDGAVEAIDFRTASIVRNGVTIVIPGTVRGLFAMHARYGRLPWEMLLLPAEQLARFGNPVARALGRRVAAMPPGVFESPDLRRLFTVDGRPVREGDILRQVQLAASLARIRLRGAGEFYTGTLTARLAEGISEDAGIDVATADFRDYRPRWIETVKVDVGNHELHMPAGPDGTAAAALWRRLADRGIAVPPPTMGDDGRSADSAGFTAIDRFGGVVACVVGAEGAFGVGRVIGETGILAAGAHGGDGFPGLPMIVVNRPRSDAIGAVTASGGAGAVPRAISAAVAAFDDGAEPDDALARAFEAEDGRTNLVRCPQGIRIEVALCRYAADPEGYGLAVSAGF